MNFFLIEVKILEIIERGVVDQVMESLDQDKDKLTEDGRGCIKKISPDESGEKYVDGLVSTGKINFPSQY